MIDYFSTKNLSIAEFDPTSLLDLEYIKNYLRIDTNLDDDFLKNATVVACRYAEQATGKILGKKTLKLALYTKKQVNKIEEAISFDSIVKIVIDDVELENSEYYTENGALFFYNSKSGNIEITFKTGLDAKDIGADLKQALLYHISAIYQNKDGNFSVPTASQEIYANYKNIKL